MKNNLIRSFILVITLAILLSSLTVFADKDKAQTIIDGIILSQGAEDPQDWAENVLSEKAGTGSEWYAISLSQYKKIDLSNYGRALKEHLNNDPPSSHSTRLKLALSLAAAGEAVPAELIDGAIGNQGLMTWIFGLHLSNNGIATSPAEAEIIEKLLSLQCADGGWGVNGKSSDVDSTAMAIQALSPHYKSNEKVGSAIDRGLELLSRIQLEDGSFKNYGVSNPESTSQVLIALCSLGIDAKTDSRFIKKEKDIFSGIEKFALPNGAFSHVEKGEENAFATEQVFSAMVAYLRFCENRSPLYILDSLKEGSEDIPEASTEPTSPSSSLKENSSSLSKSAVMVICAVLGAFVTAILLISKNKKAALWVILITVSVLILIILLYPSDKTDTKEVVGTVSLYVRCDSVAGKEEHIPQDGIMLSIDEVKLYRGDSVFTLLSAAARERRMQFEFEGSEKDAYLRGFNNLYEFDYGELSGWIYTVNGVRPSVGSGRYIPKDGDVIVWTYTLDVVVGE